MEYYQKKILFNKSDYTIVFSAGTTTYDEGLDRIASGDTTFITVNGPEKKIGIMFKQKIKDIGIYQDIE
jgi:hypothetical protein